MMNWKDTVMGRKQMINLLFEKGADLGDMGWLVDSIKIAEAQAEISFRAGYGEGLRQGYADNRDEKKAGRREVVDWLEENNLSPNYEKPEEWQAQKDKWGIG